MTIYQKLCETAKNIPIEKILAIISILVLLTISLLAARDKYGNEDVTMLIKLESTVDPFVKLPQMLPDGSSIKTVRQTDKARNEYVIVVRTRRKHKELLEWVLNTAGVEDAEFSP